MLMLIVTGTVFLLFKSTQVHICSLTVSYRYLLCYPLYNKHIFHQTLPVSTKYS